MRSFICSLRFLVNICFAPDLGCWREAREADMSQAQSGLVEKLTQPTPHEAVCLDCWERLEGWQV